MSTAKKRKEGHHKKDKNLKFKFNALESAFAIIEFSIDGFITNANKNFLDLMEYQDFEVIGCHHKIFCENTYTRSLEYKQFWRDLSIGKQKSGEFIRYSKSGHKVWIRASYSPVLDEQGEVISIIKLAQDITSEKLDSLINEFKIEAINKSLAVIEFDVEGNIETANDNFLQTLGYRLDEIKNKHHRMFCETDYTNTTEYKEFWMNLKSGKFQSGNFKRLDKDGNDVWIHATYNPILDINGKVIKVIKFASNITENIKKTSDFEWQLKAIDKSMAVIEFDNNGIILQANDNFLKTMDYNSSDIVGKHHRMFCEPEFANSNEYRMFWNNLNQGNFQSGEYKRVGNNGKEIWIQASYNPIKDQKGNVYKVVKYATDLTAKKIEYFKLVETFSHASDDLKSKIEILNTTSSELSENANNILMQANNVAASSEEVAQGVQNVSTSTEEMSASISEISQSSIQASQISDSAKEKSSVANDTILKLGEASESIGSVIKVINSIAQQTNLLALNATIEAARAGESGKGFAVVANEVKELAKQTANATESISNQIIGIQEQSKSAVNSIQEVTHIIDELNLIASKTASAVEEQSATTREVARILIESNKGVDEIANSIRNVATSSDKNSKGTENMLKVSEELNRLSEDIQKSLEKVKQ